MKDAVNYIYEDKQRRERDRDLFLLALYQARQEIKRRVKID